MDTPHEETYHQRARKLLQANKETPCEMPLRAEIRPSLGTTSWSLNKWNEHIVEDHLEAE